MYAGTWFVNCSLIGLSYVTTAGMSVLPIKMPLQDEELSQ